MSRPPESNQSVSRCSHRSNRYRKHSSRCTNHTALSRDNPIYLDPVGFPEHRTNTFHRRLRSQHSRIQSSQEQVRSESGTEIRHTTTIPSPPEWRQPVEGQHQSRSCPRAASSGLYRAKASVLPTEQRSLPCQSFAPYKSRSYLLSHGLCRAKVSVSTEPLPSNHLSLASSRGLYRAKASVLPTEQHLLRPQVSVLPNEQRFLPCEPLPSNLLWGSEQRSLPCRWRGVSHPVAIFACWEGVRSHHTKGPYRFTHSFGT
jgi:hypothetical protein